MTKKPSIRGLVHVSSDGPGYSRKGRGKGFEYFDDRGKKIASEDKLRRIKDLVIPPMWKDVWICPDPKGHLQATGFDDKGRKQYLYHEKWSEYRNKYKFHRMAEFAEALPGIRERLKEDLQGKEWTRERVLALVVRILDTSHLRIGNRTYEKENDTYGLTTLRRKHLKENGATLALQFKAKSGKDRVVSIEDKKLVKLIKDCSQLPGYELFQYFDEAGEKRKVQSQDVNGYLQEISGEAFTAKDFRTWGGTVRAVELYEEALEECRENPRRKLETCLVERVAKKLGNTTAVCRDYYLHPEVLKRLLAPGLDFSKLEKEAKRKFKKLARGLSGSELVAYMLLSVN